MNKFAILVFFVFLLVVIATAIFILCRFFRQRRNFWFGLSPGLTKMGMPDEKQFNDANIFKIDDDESHVTFEENNVVKHASV